MEDNTDNISAIAKSRNPTYSNLENGEWTSRNNLELHINELNNFKTVYNNQTRGRQNKNWWYGYPISYIYIHSNRSNWSGGIIKPILYLPISVNTDVVPEINISIPRLNFDALKDWDIEIQEARVLATSLGIFDDNSFFRPLNEIFEEIRNIYPAIPINLNNSDQNSIHLKGAIFSSEGSPYTQGLETELIKLKAIDQNGIQNTSLKIFFPDLKISTPVKSEIGKLESCEVIKLNDEQNRVLQSVFSNDLTVVTGPPGTGKSQLVASIIINAARNGKRILFASKNHKAVDVVEARLNQFANRPFIIRLGNKGSVDRNLRQELILYLNTLLGTQADITLNEKLNTVANEIQKLKSERSEILSEIEKYRTSRIKLNKLSSEFRSKILDGKNGKDSGEVLEWARKERPLLLKYLYKVLPVRNIALKYVDELRKIQNLKNIETLCEHLDEIETSINLKSQNEFSLWLDTLTLRLDSTKRNKLAEYCSVLTSIANAGQDTPARTWAQLYSKRETLMKEISGFLPAWCVTNLATKGALPFISGFFDILIVDEASQCDIPSALPLMYRAKKVVVIGDPNQLQHITEMTVGRSLSLMDENYITDSKYSTFEYTKNSLFNCAMSRIGEDNVTMLKEHFRSHSDIISFSNSKWYGDSLKILTDYNNLIPTGVNGDPKVKWIDVQGDVSQQNGSGAYISNEAEEIINVTKEIVADDNFHGELGIVTPFRLQANKIRERLIHDIDSATWQRTNLLVDTTTKFQGDERDIIIFSPVVAMNMPRGVKYYHENTLNLFNVSITRARSKLIVIGNLNACLNCGINIIQDFARYVQSLTSGNNNQNNTPNFESHYEKILYEALLEKGIQTIPQYSIDQYRLDLAYVNSNIKIDIEVDGKEFHTDWSGAVLKKDVIRNMRLQKLGWKVLRFWAYEIRDNLDSCVFMVQKEIQTK